MARELHRMCGNHYLPRRYDLDTLEHIQEHEPRRYPNTSDEVQLPTQNNIVPPTVPPSSRPTQPIVPAPPRAQLPTVPNGGSVHRTNRSHPSTRPTTVWTYYTPTVAAQPQWWPHTANTIPTFQHPTTPNQGYLAQYNQPYIPYHPLQVTSILSRPRLLTQGEVEHETRYHAVQSKGAVKALVTEKYNLISV